MAQTAAGSIAQPVSIPVIPLRELLPWALFGGLLMLLLIYFVGAEQGATSLFHGRAIGVVLGGGGVRSWAHIGALKALKEANIPIDMICGTSGGAVVADHEPVRAGRHVDRRSACTGVSRSQAGAW